MKVCVIGPTYPFRGGISHYTTLLCQHLADTHEVDLVSFRRQYPAFLFPGRTDRDPSGMALKAKCHYLIDPLNPLTWLRAFREIRKGQPDLLVLQWWVPYLAGPLASIAFMTRALTSTRVLFLCHNVMPHEERWADRLIVRLALSPAHAFIVQSEKDLADLRGLLPDSRILKAAHPRYDMLRRDDIDAEAAKRQLGLAGPVVLFFGFVREYKGLRYLLRAMPRVLGRLEVHLLVVGEFWEDKKPYLSLIEELGIATQVTIVDEYVPNEEVELYFSAADVVALPYVDATASGVAQLAFGFARPVITTDVGGMAETVEDNVTGLLVQSRDADGLADAIIRYFQHDMRDGLIANIQARTAEGQFSWSRLVEALEDVCLVGGQDPE